MNAEMILAATKFVGMALSFTLLLRARRLAVRLWATEPSYQRLPAGSDVGQPANFDRIFRA
jgi:hypothetical protein